MDDHVRTNGRGVFAAIKEAVPHLAADLETWKRATR